MAARTSKQKITGMRRIGNLWYARKVIPKDVRHLFDTGEMSKCLGPDYRVACDARHGPLAEFQADIDEARRRLKAEKGVTAPVRQTRRPLTLRELGRAVYRDILDADAALRRSGNPITDADIDEGYVADLRATAAGLAPDVVIASAVGEQIVGRQTIGSPQWRDEGRQIAGVTLEGLAHTFDRLEGKPIELKHPLLQPEPQASADHDPDSYKTLSEIAELAIEARKPKPGTANEYVVGARMFEENLGGPKPVREITRRDVTAFRKALQSAPSNYIKKFPGKTLPQAVAANQARAIKEDLMHPTTVGKWIGVVRTILGWATDAEIIETNPAAGMKIDKPKRNGPPRIPFTPDDLSRIFGSDWFPARAPLGERQWALLIALHTGLRAAEIAQLRLSSIRRERGILCFVIEEETKNDQSLRPVPVHSTLVTLGLEMRLDDLRNANENRLFPEWFKQGDELKKTSLTANQTFANFIPRAFNRTLLRSNLKISDKRKTFHSLRHTLKTALERAGVTRHLSDAITGHDDESSGGGYVHEYPTEALLEALEKIHFDGLDLRHMMTSR